MSEIVSGAGSMMLMAVYIKRKHNNGRYRYLYPVPVQALGLKGDREQDEEDVMWAHIIAHYVSRIEVKYCVSSTM